jgi:hypothetical protein
LSLEEVIMMYMFPNHQKNLLLYFLGAFFLICSCTEKIERPVPLYEDKQVHDPLTFGPGTHNKVVIYKNVSGWVGGREPEWTSCRSLNQGYSKLIKKYHSFKNENINVFSFAGPTWISSFIVTDNDHSTVFEVTEWDDDANYGEIDQKDLVKIVCQNYGDSQGVEKEDGAQ